MPRKYFPFYFSFYETAQTMPPRIRATFYEAIIQYGVTGKEPTLPKSISGYWPIIQPVLDTSHKRYDAAKKRNKSSENNGFATYKEKKEKEKENEKERDKEKKEKEAADAVSGGATQQDRQDVFAQFAGEDSALLQALQDYDLMRQEKHKGADRHHAAQLVPTAR